VLVLIQLFVPGTITLSSRDGIFWKCGTHGPHVKRGTSAFCLVRILWRSNEKKYECRQNYCTLRIFFVHGHPVALLETNFILDQSNNDFPTFSWIFLPVEHYFLSAPVRPLEYSRICAFSLDKSLSEYRIAQMFLSRRSILESNGSSTWIEWVKHAGSDLRNALLSLILE
jgi:hypothetical protein